MFKLSRAECAAWAALLGLSVLFVVYPEIDLALSRAAYLGDGSFVLKRIGAGAFYYDARSLVFPAFLLVLGGALIMNLVDTPIKVLTPRETVAVLVSIALAPGLIAHLLVKEQFGRARPNDIVEFGGSLKFTPAWFPSDQCASNCSFVSGDAAFAFIGLAFALCCPRGRTYAVAAAIAFGAAVGVIRVLQGAHFASDAIIGGLITVVTVLAVHRLLVDQAAALGKGFLAPGGWLDTWPVKIRRVFQGKVRDRGAARRLHDN